VPAKTEAVCCVLIQCINEAILPMKMTQLQQVHFQDLGLISFKKAWDYQQQLLRQTVDAKRHNGDLPTDSADRIPQKHHLLFCEHPPVYTLGKSGSLEHLLLSEKQLVAQGFEFFKINRGGDITYHGPGQIVGYPIFDLDLFFTDIRKYISFLEEAVIRTLAEYGIKAGREKGYTGVWLPARNGLRKRKICAIGVHLSRWVTMHGFAFNVNTELSHFDHIVPCGIEDADKEVTSMQRELEQSVDIEEVKKKLKVHFAALFEFEYAD